MCATDRVMNDTPGQHTAYIGLGSNLGGRMEYLRRAAELVHRHPACTVLSIAPVYRSEPLGEGDQEFLNTAMKVQTTLAPIELLALLKDTEQRLGRKERVRWHNREIDMDILLYDDLVLTADAIAIPHKEMLKRDFVMKPLTDIAPEAVHPELKKKIADITIADTEEFVLGVHPVSLVIEDANVKESKF